METKTAFVSDEEIISELEEEQEQREYEKLIAEEKYRLKQILCKNKKKGRTELEQIFIGKILHMASLMEIRKYVADLNADYKISWRRFADNCHRVIWRSLETFDLLSVDERKKIIEEEAYAKHEHFNRALISTEDDPVRGEYGSAAEKEFLKMLNDKSSGMAWFERVLESAEMLRLIGGKLYLQKIAELGNSSFLSDSQIAEILFK